MIELVKKAMFTGVGALSLTKEKVEEIVGEFVKKGNLSEQEGERLVEEMLNRSEESKKELKQQVDNAVHAALAKLDIATKSDIAELKTQLRELTETFSHLKDKE